MKNLLHVGCGGHHILGKHGFSPDEWREIRLDINPAMQPDVIASITSMPQVADNSIDAVYSSHSLEHLYAHEVSKALAEFRRVLRDDGFCLIIVPDIQPVAKMVAEGRLTETAYNSSAGAITPLDIMYGHRASIEAGNEFMAHKTAFTGDSLSVELLKPGLFKHTRTRQKGFNLAVIASYKPLSEFAISALKSIF